MVEQFEFCFIHLAEMKVIPDGIAEGYLMKIDFSILPNRIEVYKPDLIKIIKREARSIYRDNIMNIYDEIGKAKANRPMNIMNRIETYQVI